MIKTNIMGMEISNPLVITSGPWTRGRKRLKKALESNVGAVFTESIVSEEYMELSPRFAYDRTGRGLENIRLYSSLALENWISDLAEINEAERYGSDTKIIASVVGTTPSEAAYIARKVESTGVDAIELGIASPMDEGPVIIASDPEKVYEYTKETVKAVDIPVSVKLSAVSGNLAEVVKACNKAGAAGISGTDTIRCILDIDIETGRPKLPTYGGYSGAPIRPIGLSTVAGIAQSTSLPIVGIGGIETYENLLEYIMAGASAGGIGTAVMLKGYKVVDEILTDLDAWLIGHGVNDIEDIRGEALGCLRSFEEIKIEHKTAGMVENCDREDCRLCVDCCMDEAVTFDETIGIDKELCTGCGLCIDVCPDRKIELKWK